MKKIVLLAIATCFLASCSADPDVGPAVVVITEERVNHSPADVQQPLKRGEACALNILGLVSTGDASIEEAKLNGGIKKVVSIDKHIKGINLYLIFARSCTVVTGY